MMNESLVYPGDNFIDTYDEKFNKLIYGDCKPVMEEMLDKGWGEKVDLLYMDPPFFSGENYEVIWGSKREKRFFEDMHWDNIDSYIKTMTKRVNLAYKLLKPTGSFYFHCDFHAVAHIRIMLDTIFGDDEIKDWNKKRFKNEIIWYYTAGTRGKRKWARKHDNILFYTKSNEWTFNWESVAEPFESNMTEWRYTKGGQKGKPMPIGKVPADVFKIQLLNTMSKERLGYPTQKPEALVERIIKASSNPGDIMLDPFCGCGTSIAVARRLGRRFVGIDLTTEAIKTMNLRLNVAKDIPQRLDYVIIGMPKSPEDLKNIKDYEFQQWACDQLLAINTSPNPGKGHSGADKGIDGIVDDKESEDFNGALIEVKQSHRVGRPVVQKLRGAMASKGIKLGFIVAFSFAKSAREEVDRYLRQGDSFIKLVSVKEILKHQKDNHYDFTQQNRVLHNKYDRYLEVKEE